MSGKVRGWVCFFFQAEDGIRDLTVTGVQTCALPISLQLRVAFRGKGSHGTELNLFGRDLSAQACSDFDHTAPLCVHLGEATPLQPLSGCDFCCRQIVLRLEEL